MGNDQKPRSGKPFQLRFTGTLSEYFKIWIVNLALTLITFGVYYAWAKVRTKKYFYDNTILAGSGFAYTALPLDIFKGWLLAASFFLVYSIATKISMISALLFAAALIMLTPWMVMKSLMYRARHSTYHGMHFTFNSNYNDAVYCFLLLPIAAILSAGLLIPYTLFQQKKFLVENHTYGNFQFSFVSTPFAFYKVAIVSFTLMFVSGIGASFLHASPEPYNLLAPVELALVYTYAIAFFNAGITNLTYKAITLRHNSFDANLRAHELLGLYIVHAFALVFSLGFLYPWVKIRMTRYRCKHITFYAVEKPERLATQDVDKSSATSDEISEFLGFDFGL